MNDETNKKDNDHRLSIVDSPLKYKVVRKLTDFKYQVLEEIKRYGLDPVLYQFRATLPPSIPQCIIHLNMGIIASSNALIAYLKSSQSQNIVSNPIDLERETEELTKMQSNLSHHEPSPSLLLPFYQTAIHIKYHIDRYPPINIQSNLAQRDSSRFAPPSHDYRHPLDVLIGRANHCPFSGLEPCFHRRPANSLIHPFSVFPVDSQQAIVPRITIRIIQITYTYFLYTLPHPCCLFIITILHRCTPLKE